MTNQELLMEVLKDPILVEKYKIPQEELDSVSFDTKSSYQIIEAIKTVIQLKGQNLPDANVYKNVKLIFNVD